MIELRRWKPAIDACLKAARIHQAGFCRVEVMTKADGSPVTCADRDAERVMREILLAEYPNDGFVGEEGGERAGTSGKAWTADPLDGTIQFVRGMADFGVLLARHDERGIELGILCHSMTEGLWIAERGKGAYRTSADRIEPHSATARLRTNRDDAPRTIERAVVCFGHVHQMPGAGIDIGLLVSRFKTTITVDRFLAFTKVAQGGLDVFIGRLENDWDLFANQIIVEEAGGTVLLVPLRNGRHVVAARSRRLAEQAVEAIQRSIC